MFRRPDVCMAVIPMLIARLLKDRRGSILPIVGLCAMVLFGFVGVAVDYARANRMKVELQAALDSTALMLSKEADQYPDDATLTVKANDYFTAMFKDAAAKNINVTASKTSPQ